MIMKKKNKKKRSTKTSLRGSDKDNYVVVCHYKEGVTSYSPFYGTGEQLKKFALKKKKDKYEGKLPKRVSIELA